MVSRRRDLTAPASAWTMHRSWHCARPGVSLDRRRVGRRRPKLASCGGRASSLEADRAPPAPSDSSTTGGDTPSPPPRQPVRTNGSIGFCEPDFRSLSTPKDKGARPGDIRSRRKLFRRLVFLELERGLRATHFRGLLDDADVGGEPVAETGQVRRLRSRHRPGQPCTYPPEPLPPRCRLTWT